ncbi:MAG: peptidylprolyl isomerase [Acidobacteriota bacterium]
MKRWALAAAIAVCTAAGATGWQGTPGLFTKLDPVIDAIWAGFDTGEAQRHVEFISQYWRLPGNAGYDASLDRIQARLSSAGFSALKGAPQAGASGAAARLFFDQYPNTESGGWDHTRGTLAIAGSDAAGDEVVLSRDKDRLALCINSFSTPPEGVVAPLYDVGRGDSDEDYAGKTLKGAVVLGDADAGQLWRRAVVNAGAIGVVSTALPRYLSPDPPGAPPTPRDQWDILQWSSIPYDAARKGFGFKATPRAAARLRQTIASRRIARPGSDETAPSDHVLVRVKISSTFSSKPVRTLVGEIPGAVVPAERVILAAHVQEPGANDNASGVATLAELAVALQSGIRAGKIPPPARTLTFLFLNEISGSRRWLQDHAADVKGVRYMISMDMTGEDVTKTGGTFLVERWPDPGAVWDRPWDPHTEWGRGNVRADQLKGDLINDAHLAVCERVARKTSWVVKSNPYEGGSDHTVFGSAGIPAILDWHFTDRHYHTNFDTPDKTSPAEMRNVGVCAASTAWLFASSDASISMSVAELVADAGKTRIALEEREGAKLAATDKDPAAAKTREGQIVGAWRKWYSEAVRSVSRLVVGSAPADFTTRLDALAAEFERVRSADWVSSPRTRSADWFPNPRSAVRIVPASFQATQGRDTPLFVCGTDMLVPPIPFRWDTLVLAADAQEFMPCPEGRHTSNHREAREGALLHAARKHDSPEFRRVVAQAWGRMGGGWSRVGVLPGETGAANLADMDPSAYVDTLGMLLNDGSPVVRREAANAIGEHLSGVPRELHPVQRVPPDNITRARQVLEKRLAMEKDDEVAATILETLGRLKYQDDASRDEIETFLVRNASGPAIRILGATKGLEAVIRGNVKRQVSNAGREKLRAIAVAPGPAVASGALEDTSSKQLGNTSMHLARSRRLAMLALQQARDDDTGTVVRAAGDADWQVRRLAVLRLDLVREEFKPIIKPLLADPVFQVRYEMVGPIARYATSTRDCSLLLRNFKDPEPTVVLRTIDLLPAVCAENEDITRQLVAWAENLRTPLGPHEWHTAAHALEALARLHPDAAGPLLELAVSHQIWQVRARAAAASIALKNEDAARRLAEDAEPNVRTAALEALVALKSPTVFHLATQALDSRDYQLIRAAAIALRGTPEPERVDAVNALLATLRRLTEQADDTSRDPRVAIIERLGELLWAERTADLGPFREDFDRKVREAADAAVVKIIGTRLPEASAIKHRYPYQPLPETLAALPHTAVIAIEGGGEIQLEMLVDQAPVTIARFAELVRAGYYNNLTFHRVVPNFVIQGGSPGANEYMGATRYMRDEVGTEPHTRGAVGISTRGRDTGDAQIFIDLVDNPRLDHEYTVFARVVSGLDVVDRVLEGARMMSVTVK